MNRRDFLRLGAGAALASRSARAARRVARIGFVGPGSRQADQDLLGALRAGLDGLGWADSRDIVVLDRWAEGRIERLPGLAEELLGSGVDVLVTAGTPATLAAKAVAPTVPIVLVGVGDPVAVGAVEGLARPGGNLTGLSLASPELVARRLRLLQDLVPGLDRVAAILRDDPGLEQRVVEVRSSAGRIGLDLVEFAVSSGQTLDRAFLYLRGNRCGALYLASGPLGPAKRAQIIALAAQSRLPAVYPLRVFAAAGGLMSLGPDSKDLFRRAAGFVDRILNGAKPADLPVEEPRKFELAINLKAAEALGLAMSPAILARADELIE